MTRRFQCGLQSMLHTGYSEPVEGARYRWKGHELREPGRTNGVALGLAMHPFQTCHGFNSLQLCRTLIEDLVDAVVDHFLMKRVHTRASMFLQDRLAKVPDIRTRFLAAPVSGCLRSTALYGSRRKPLR